jgi:hypothetical protein
VDDRLEFACRCSPEQVAEVEEIWDWAQALNPKYLTTRMDVLNFALYRMSDWGARFDIAADMWAMVSASNEAWTGKYAIPHFSSAATCDDITDGFIYVFKQWHDHYEGKSSHEIRKPVDPPPPPA